ncbi:MAG: hypothetical protein Q4B82_09250 [Alysiella sp.]|uniref:hypothetical protein n=1 Tax=Alysiella sp. TaxID=1872483 RepID=UPI0026DC178C|nr:hypothetical protein [Alysiella sp.]MDO4434745.1 hypothetical protein [Alysiella sp.]
MIWDFQAATLLVYGLIFVWQAFKHVQMQWLWSAIVLWLSLGLLSAQIMPNVLGITHWANAFLLPLYLFSGSIFFWINQIERLPENNKRPKWRSKNGSIFLSLFAQSLLLVHLAFLLLSVMIAWTYPKGLSAFLAAHLFNLYYLNPLHHMCLQALLMFLFACHRHINHERADVFNLIQLKMGFLITLTYLLAALGKQLIHNYH